MSDDGDVKLGGVLMMDNYRPVIIVVFPESFYTKTNIKNNRLVRHCQTLLE